MRIANQKFDLLFLVLIIVIVAGLPLGIWAYDRYLEPRNLPPGTKEFTLTGNARQGWLLGEVNAHSIISLWQNSGPANKPVIEVAKGDLVVLKLRSSDVTHGFSLKAYGIYLAEGINPGKTVYVSFRADKTGTFIFSCNVYCGAIHQNMQGTLVVKG